MIRIITDSGADIQADEARRLAVDVVPLSIEFEGAAYAQDEDTDFAEFYTLLESAKTLPKTSQPSPEQFAAVYRRYAGEGDSVVVVALSSGLSGTYQSAVIAKDMAPEVPVHVVDTRSALAGQRILVEEAVKMRDAGASAEEIAEALTALRARVVVYGMVDTLTYLSKGGRLPRSVAIAGNLLHIKPIVYLDEKGAIAVMKKARSYQALLSVFSEGPAFDPDFPVYFGYSAYDDVCKKVSNQILERHALPRTGMCPIGSVLGTHVGPRCVAVAYVRK